MPVLYLNPERLISFIGDRGIALEKLNEILFSLKSESSLTADGLLEVEVNSDRPDLFISEGIARAVKGLIGYEKGLFQPRIQDSSYMLKVDEVPSRPFIAIGIVRGVELGEEGLKELIQFQEKLHITIGRNRRKMAIGIHDLRKIPSQDLRYTMVMLEHEMFPLGIREKKKIREVLSGTPQGRSYGEISLIGGAHPAIFSGDEIISLPPVINSEITRIEPDTKDLLIDVTGINEETVLKTLDLITSILNEKTGSIIERVHVLKPNGERRKDPLLNKIQLALEKDYAEKVLGLKLDEKEIADLLERMRLGVEKAEDFLFRVTVPEYRSDILHPVDLVEDIAMAYGYSRIVPMRPSFSTEGSLERFSRISRILRMYAVGLGFQEVSGFVLTGDEANLFLRKGERIMRIKNPVSENMKFVRPTNIISLLLVLRENQHVELPLKIFEIGENVVIGGSRILQRRTIALAIMKDELSFEEIQAPIYSILSNFSKDVVFRRDSIDYLLQGRTAKVSVEGIPVGILGEVHPQILTEMGIKYPVGVGELDLSSLSSLIERKKTA
ncbi:MAG: phenylalanine--tRNA ligase subunit beta [Fervidicoccaceae archaeon]